MTDELYLILHKVRGKPAFDVAQKIMIGNEEGWIIPTSGHRAYPSEWKPLEGLCELTSTVIDHALPTDLPDHYDTKRDTTPMLDKLRAALKFKTKPTVPLRRL